MSLHTDGVTSSLLESYEAFLPTLFITSSVVLAPNDSKALSQVAKESPKASESGNVFMEQDDDGQYAGSAVINVKRTTGTKCERCWRYVNSVSTSGPSGLCKRCVEALAEAN